MKHDREIEYIPLEGDRKKSPNKRGFLTRLLDCLSSVTVKRYGGDHASSSGEEVEEEVIKF